MLPLFLIACPSPETLLETDTPTSDAFPIEGLTARMDTEVRTLIHVEWEQITEGDVFISYSYDGGERWMQTPVTTRPEGPAKETLFGIPAEQDVQIVLTVQNEDESVEEALTESIRTGRLPDPLFDPDLNQPMAEGALGTEWMLMSVEMGPISFGGPFFVVIVNRAGQIVWYDRISGDRVTLFPRVRQDGQGLIFEASALYTFDGQIPAIVRTSLDKTAEEEIEIPEFGFAYDELPDGSLVYDASPVIPDQMTLRHRDNEGVERILWECAPWMSAFGAQPDEACMTNTIVWRPETETVLWSMFATGTVLEIDTNRGEVARQWGQLPGSWETIPDTSTFSWQHFPNFTVDGTLLVTTHIEGAEGEQRFREFRLDEDAKTLTEVWSYGAGVDRYADYVGEATRLENGNTLIGYGSDGVLKEVTPSGEVVWEIEWADKLIGHATPIVDLYPLNGPRP